MTDTIALGNTAAQIIFMQELTRLVAVALGRAPSELAAWLENTVSERINALTLAEGNADEMRDAARTMLAKIIGGIN